MKNFEKIFSLQKRNEQYNGWFRDSSEFYYLLRMQEELEEVKQELLEQNLEDLEEEMGDLLWVVLNLIAKLEHKGYISSDRMIDRAIEKFSERLPYIVEGRLLEDKEERSRIWAEAKKAQKARKAAK